MTLSQELQNMFRAYLGTKYASAGDLHGGFCEAYIREALRLGILRMGQLGYGVYRMTEDATPPPTSTSLKSATTLKYEEY